MHIACESGNNGESNNILVIDDQCKSTRIEYDMVAALQELCSNASHEQILLCLNKNDGDVNRAAQELLGISNTTPNGKQRQHLKIDHNGLACTLHNSLFSQPHPNNCHTNTVCVYVSSEPENSDNNDNIIASISMHIHSTPEKMKTAIKS